jgi:hypothetical protein
MLNATSRSRLARILKSLAVLTMVALASAPRPVSAATAPETECPTAYNAIISLTNSILDEQNQLDGFQAAAQWYEEVLTTQFLTQEEIDFYQNLLAAALGEIAWATMNITEMLVERSRGDPDLVQRELHLTFALPSGEGANETSAPPTAVPIAYARATNAV